MAFLALRGLYGNMLSGPAAVIVFFVISGFCIHYPFAGSNKRPRLKEFYARRFIRLLVPVAVAVPLSGLIGVRLALFHESILWSLLAELIYYILYPALRAAHLRLGSWRWMVGASFLAAFALIATNPAAGDYPSYGPAWNWLLGLPCWLLGCVLAESARKDTSRTVGRSHIWVWRLVVMGVAGVCSSLRYHSPVGYPWTLNLFALLVTVWLQREIAFRGRVTPAAFFEWAGVWSYSLYLLHAPAGMFFATHFPAVHGTAWSWVVMLLFVLSVCYVFHLLIERPSHALARSAARRFRPIADPSMAAKTA